MEFREAVESAFTNKLIYTGRSSRSEYWYYVLFETLVTFGFSVVFGIIESTSPSLKTMVSLLIFCLYIVLKVIALSLTIRRLHDTNRSGWWFLLAFIPFVDIAVFIFMLLPSDLNDNNYGAPPLLESR